MENYIPKDDIYYLWSLFASTRESMLKTRSKELNKLLKPASKSLQGLKISAREAFILYIIRMLGEEASINKVASIVHREHHTVSIQITRLMKKGLLIKKRVKSVKNRLVLELTERGKEISDLAEKRESIYMIMGALTRKESQQLKLYLDKLLRKSIEVYKLV